MAIGIGLSVAAWGGTFGKVVAIGGHASDVALDEARGVLYIANFTANRVEVMSLASSSIQTSFNVSSQPSALSISPDGRHLVVAHYSNFTAPNTPRNALTVIELNSGARQTFSLAAPPLGVAFGIDGRALVATTRDFLLFDPVLGTTQVLATVADVVANTLPQPQATFPPEIVAASMAASGDRTRIFGITDTIRFRYEVQGRRIVSTGYSSEPPMGPRTVSASRNGAYYLAGWALLDDRGLLAQFPDPTGDLHIGSHAIDSDRGIIYAQIPSRPAAGSGQSGGAAEQPPVLQIVEADNLAVRERLQLPENLAGKSVLSSDGQVMYSVSDSGVAILPVGSLDQAPRVAASHADVVFRGNLCDWRVAPQEITIYNPGGGSTDFSISSSAPGVTVSPNAGITPAVVRVSVDPSAFQNVKGTSVVELTLSSHGAVNLPKTVRVLINVREPDQRGTIVNVPGKLVDVLADPVRNRFFLLRQDTNQVLVFDGATYSQIATLRTGNTPTQMAVTFDRRYLLVGNDNSQLANVYDLETLQPSEPIRFPAGHYPRSIAASGNAILAATRVAGPIHKIDRINMASRLAVELPTIGIYENDIDINTVLTASPNGSSILAAQADGRVLLYNANVDSFTVSRKDSGGLRGAYAASSFDQFVVGASLLNSSLMPIRKFAPSAQGSSGFAFVDQFGFWSSSLSESGPGVIARVELAGGDGLRSTRMAEAPVLGRTGAVFTRTIAPLANRSAIINLTTSGFTALAWNYDAAVAPPKLEAVVNAADGSHAVAPGSLISLYGRDLSPTNVATREMPLPTALGESCLTVNGLPVPVLFVSPSQINAQLPFTAEGNVTMILRTPGGVSDNFNLTVLPGAPSVFRSGVAGPETDLPTVIRVRNGQLVTLANPIHRGEAITIYLTGLGKTTPEIEAGNPAPGDPPAVTLSEPTVTLGGVPLNVTFSGLTPGQVGVYQINADVPHWISTGMQVPLTVSQGGSSTTLTVRVVN
ncbi:MAG: hypothetical protein ACK5AZ_07710 [Bryobacteraceae bacterium]